MNRPTPSSHDVSEQPVARWAQRHGFGLFLATLAGIAIGPAVAEAIGPTVGVRLFSILLIALFGLGSFAAVSAVAKTRASIYLGTALSLAMIASQTAVIGSTSPAAIQLAHFTTMTCLGWTIFKCTQELFRIERPSPSMINSAICIYLVSGIFWAVGYSFVELNNPGSFQTPTDDTLRMFSGQSKHAAIAIYYSFVTLSTLGYGDITPISHLARLMSITEAVCGQIFLAVLIACLVGLHVAILTSSAQKDHGDQ